MAEQDRLTNKQRREKARSERRTKAEQQARQRRRDALRNALVALVAIAAVAGLVYQAFFVGDESLEDALLISSEDVEQARQAAGCEPLVVGEPLPDSAHFDRNQAPPADAIYPEIRPTHSGPHATQFLPPISGTSSQIDELASTHNLEHGAIIVWYDPEQVDEGAAEEMGDWARALNDSGFRQDQGGSAIFVSPYEEPGISSGKAVALRAWGTAVDCEQWDETAANGFVAEHYGDRGGAPERHFAPYPDGVLEVRDGEGADDEADADEADGGTDETDEAGETDDTGGDEVSEDPGDGADG